MKGLGLKINAKSFLAVVFALVLSLGFNFYYLTKDKLSQKSEEYSVVRVIDGDTFDVGGDVRIRLAGVDAPEYPKGCLSEEAKQRLTDLIGGKSVKTVFKEKDDFGRLVSFVWVGDLFIDKAMVSEGMGTSSNSNDPTYGVELLGSEDEAKSASRGVWSQLCVGPPDPACQIKGNVRRDRKTKVYHVTDCYNYEKIVVDTREGDQWFCSEEEASEAGFTKSEDCP